VRTDKDTFDSADRFTDSGSRFTSDQIDVKPTHSGTLPPLWVKFGQQAGTPVTGHAYTLKDDDEPVSMLPSDSLLTAKFVPAYISARVDGGGDETNNETGVQFVENLEDSARLDAIAAHRQCPAATPQFWTLYCLGAFQGSKTRDRDPDSENAHLGIADTDGVTILRETGRDIGLDSEDESQALCHELGHMFGLLDVYNEEFPGIMRAYMTHGFRGVFTNGDLKTIRSGSVPTF